MLLLANQGAADTTLVRAQNSALILRMLWRERQLTRVELVQRTGLSHSTVSAIVQGLERASLVRTLGAAASRGGRRPSLLGFCDEAFSIIGVEIGARHVAVALTDLRGRVRLFEERRFAVRTDPHGTLAAVRALIDELTRKDRLPMRQVLGIGVAVPSPVDPSAPGLLSELIFPAWRGVDVHAFLHEAYGRPVCLDNDANLGALAERWWGAGMDGGDLTYVKVGAGVGAGHIIRGELYRGATGTAGEIGHVPIDPQGPMCVCGNRGCLTTFIGSEELSERAREVFELDERPTLTDVVVIGGEISTVGDMLLDALRRSVRGRALPSAMAHTRIVTSNLGPRAIAIGAATLILESALKDPQLFPTNVEEA
jgi:predicted NBD/HSP70 family sugar kinase